MKRPYLVNFLSISSNNQISIKASVTDSYTPLLKSSDGNLSQNIPTSPIQSIGIMSSDEYRIKVVGIGFDQKEIFIREYDSDSFGNFDIKIPLMINNQKIMALQVYEVSYHEGLQLLLGTYIPYEINNPKKIIISDFDKTLLDTKFYTAKEVYHSLSKPLNTFPAVEGSIDLFNQFIDEKFQPFILSASPHFYENAIRDWLYQNGIYAGNIFLKDYRNIFSFSAGVLTPKDMKNQGFYKLNQLVNILLMTGMPDKLVLMGDGFESDAFIYLCLRSILVDNVDPWNVWNRVKKEKAFRLTSKQHSQFLSKFYQLGEIAKQSGTIDMSIYIRCTKGNIKEVKNRNFNQSFIDNNKNEVEYYIA
jgi:hypothetical protein